MTFEEILAHVIEVLQYEGRISYRALQRRFNLDDAYLDDVKVELIEAKQLARDENGRILVWAKQDATMASPPTAQEAPPGSLPAVQTPQEAPAHVVPSAPEAERRQLTVLFCDLADSTRLARQLDPEDLREVIRAYQATCVTVIQRFGGHVAQYLGDGLLVYFGYPQAHEDDAQRAVRTGLGMLEAMGTLSSRLLRDTSVRLAVRIGIHTGLVVVGEMGSGGRHEHLALGDTPNLAARLQELAAPNTVVISAATSRLVEGYFTCHALGAHALKGFDTPVHIAQVVGESTTQSRLDVAASRGLTPLVGREEEVGLLLRCWAQSQDGRGQVVLLSGEAGIGKSRLVQVLKDRIANTPHTRWECRCSPYYQNTALYPLIDLLERALHFQRDESLDAKLEKLESTLSQYRFARHETVSLFATLLSLPLPEARYTPLSLTPERQKQKTLEALLAALLEMAEQQPVLFIVDDLHWVDPSTREFLHLLITRGPTAAILTVLTYRPDFQPPWGGRTYLTPLALQRLSPADVEAIVMQITGGKPLPPEVLQHVVTNTDGVPLFVEELTKTILESGILRETEAHYELTGPLPTLTIPTTLHDVLMARLDRLSTVKAVAQLGATLGRTFAYDLLQAVAPFEEATLQHGLQQLVEAELLYQRGLPPQATYRFKHALLQEAAYQSLLKSTRQRYHQRIAQVLEAQFPETVATQPELLAHHYTEAGLSEQALGYWQRAGERALQRSAHVEAISHLTQGLELLQVLPDTPDRLRHELALRISLGASFMATKGYAALEVEQAYTRARELCQQLGETPQLFSVLRGLWAYYLTRMELEVALEISEQLQRLAQHAGNQALRVRASFAVGQTLFHLGEFGAARASLEEGIALFDSQRWSVRAMPDPGLGCFCYIACVRWMLGYPDQSLQSINEALRLAQEQSHAFSVAFTLLFAALCHDYRGEQQATQERVEALIALATEQEFGYLLTLGQIMRGWGRCVQGQGEEGMAQIRQGLNAMRNEGAEILRPYFLALLANAYSTQGQTAEGLEVVGEALATGHATGQRYYEAELHRLKGELLLQRALPDERQVETCLQEALDVSRQQQARSLELRATTSLSRLWQQQGRRVEARELLAPVFQWFTEGFDTTDLQEAQALLEELE